VCSHLRVAALVAAAAVVPGPGCSGGGGGCIGPTCTPQLPQYTTSIITGGPYFTACPAGPATFDGLASTSADGGPLASYLWEIVDPSSGQFIALDSTSTMNLAAADQPWMQAGGTYEVWLTVTDAAGEWPRPSGNSGSIACQLCGSQCTAASTACMQTSGQCSLLCMSYVSQ
jgi:hypothetical protein